MSASGEDVSDLLGASGAQGTGDGSDPGAQSDVRTALDNGIAAATQGDQEQQDETERKLIDRLLQEYKAARDFDKHARVGYQEDRKYAAGLSDPSWASDANLIGSYIDILTSFLYAQNPDVSCRAAAQVGSQPNDDNTAFAETVELLVPYLWRVGGLKKAGKRQVRGTLSVAIGWLKAVVWSEKRPQPTVEKELHTAEAQLARIKAMIAEAQDDATEDMSVEQARLSQLITGLRAKTMLLKNYGMNIDYVRPENIQVSLDVASLSDYASAEWISEDMYIPRKALRARFPRLTDEDEDRATIYYQRPVAKDLVGDALAIVSHESSADGQFSESAPTTGTGTKAVEFVKIIEFWDRRDNMIKTMCAGVKRWCVEPYPPPQATTRFYPYFSLAFYEVDGLRHPQSLSWRLRKLQDEYNAARSNQRLTRERSIPGLIFNAGVMSPEDARKLEVSVIAEMVGLRPTDITLPIQNIVMAKPLPTIDVRLWDTRAIRADMETLSGVQEAMQQSMMMSQPKSATQAQIEQQGFATRTAADRDKLEEMLDDLALYTLEAAIQEIDPQGAQRIAGPLAFWPFGMDVQDLLTIVNIDITAGTTGKPDLAAEKANWSAILPLLQKLVVQVRQVQQSDPALAKALENLLRESLRRMDDRLDIDQFIPSTPAPPPPPPPPTPPPTVSISLKGDLPPLDAATIGAKAAGLPPEAALADGGAPPTALQDASGIPTGELPPHPMISEPLPAPKKTPEQGGHTQMKT
ncbi:MAG: hypothetical protein KGL39_14710 [Patescibacteria group bacterium]|nr:hypothetical protein [Patescibacteria group bacterium]